MGSSGHSRNVIQFRMMASGRSMREKHLNLVLYQYACISLLLIFSRFTYFAMRCSFVAA